MALSLAENAKLGALEELGSGGRESTVVSGAVVSTVQAALAGDWSALPAASTARTETVWAPSARPL